MSKKANVVIFVDALNFETGRDFFNEENNEFKIIKILPGVGYSSNLHWTLFRGKGPDDVGFFTDWNLNSKEKQIKLNKYINITNLIDRVYVLNILTRVILRKFSVINNNIPFSESKAFKNKGKYLFNSIEENTEFLKHNMKAIKKKSYEETFNEAYKYLNDEGLFLIIEDLDHIGHEVGGTGDKYKAIAKDIMKKSIKFYSAYSKVHNDVNFIIISDHGMSDININIDIFYPLINRFGLPGKDYYFYNDSLYLRFWFTNNTTKDNVMNFILNNDIFIYINEELRRRYKITDRSFGDEIFILKKGYVFHPNCFNISVRSNLMGMHGYIEDGNDSSGLTVTNLNLDFLSISCEQVYNALSESMGEKT